MCIRDRLYRIADGIGYPVLLKASAGGGGKGMRRIYKREDLVPGWELTRREAKASFANDDIYIETVSYTHLDVYKRQHLDQALLWLFRWFFQKRYKSTLSYHQ